MAANVTAETLRQRKVSGEPIAALTAYDFPTAVLLDQAGIDVILVGDSLGRIILGRPRLEQTTMEDMIHHCAAVSRGTSHALVVGDMPFGTYEIEAHRAVENAVRLVKEAGVGAVKVEGGFEVVPAVHAIAAARIPVFGHLTPAYISHAPDQKPPAKALVEAALALEEAGATAIVLVDIDREAAQEVTAALRHIPSLGYNSGPHCDGQLLVTPYMLGMLPAADPVPGPYGAFGRLMADAFASFCTDVRSGRLREGPLRPEDIAHR